jgi:subfamily B ATP-binding cassette protein HlyB/CyaB
MPRAAVFESQSNSGLQSLYLIARSLGVSKQPEELCDSDFQSDTGPFTANLVRAARALGLRAQLVSTKWKHLQKTSLPAIACLKDGSFIVAAKFIDGKILVQYPIKGRPHLLEAAEFNYLWSGEMILLGRPSPITPFNRIFGMARLLRVPRSEIPVEPAKSF